MKGEIRRLFSLGVPYPLPPEVVLHLSAEFDVSPLMAESCAMAVWHGKTREQWSFWEEEFIRQNYATMSDEELGRMLRRSPGSVRDKRLSMGCFRR